MGEHLIHNCTIVNESKTFNGGILIKNGLIKRVYCGGSKDNYSDLPAKCMLTDAEGKICIPGVIDDQVHFREPGLEHKGDIYTESRAAVAGGITSFMEMPNTTPQTVTQELLEEKYVRASKVSLANYSFYIGATNNNLDELLRTDPKKVCGIKIFMGSSTGNMLVDDENVLSSIFKSSPVLVAVHCEDEDTIKKNTLIYRNRYGDDVPIGCHSEIRSAEACFRSSSFAVGLAKKFNTRLHLLHLSTADELELLDNAIPSRKKMITGEVCIHHLWFDDTDYKKHGTLIKWNPSIKTKNDKEALLEAVLSDKLDVIATDHAPHLFEEKQNTYFKAPSGGPLVQHSLHAMLEFYRQGKISLEKLVEKMCHSPADIFKVSKRGYIREGYHADLVLIDMAHPWTVEKSNILYKCNWSPFEGYTFGTKVVQTYVNGHLVWDNGRFDDSKNGERLNFDLK